MKNIFLGLIITVLTSHTFAGGTGTEGGGDGSTLREKLKARSDIQKIIEEEDTESLRIQYQKVFRGWANFSINLFSLMKYLEYPFKNQILIELTQEKIKKLLEPFLQYDTTSNQFSLDNNLAFKGQPLTFYSSPTKVIMNPKRWHKTFSVKTEKEGRKAIPAALALFIHEALVIDGKESTLDFSISDEVATAFYTVLSDPNGWRWMEKSLLTIEAFKNIKISCSYYDNLIDRQGWDGMK